MVFSCVYLRGKLVREWRALAEGELEGEENGNEF